MEGTSCKCTRTEKCACHIFAPFFCAQTNLCRRGPVTYQYIIAQWHPYPCSAMIRQQVCVIIAPLLLSLAVKRYRDHYIGMQIIVDVGFCKQLAQRLCHASITPIF